MKHITVLKMTSCVNNKLTQNTVTAQYSDQPSSPVLLLETALNSNSDTALEHSSENSYVVSTENDIPFFTVARYRNPTAPSTYELAAIPSGTAASAVLPDLLVEPSKTKKEPQFTGSWDLKRLSPIEIAFGKYDEGLINKWLGKTVTSLKNQTTECENSHQKLHLQNSTKFSLASPNVIDNSERKLAYEDATVTDAGERLQERRKGRKKEITKQNV